MGTMNENVLNSTTGIINRHVTGSDKENHLVLRERKGTTEVINKINKT